MKPMYKLFCILFLATMLLSLLPSVSFAAFDQSRAELETVSNVMDFVLLLDCSNSGNDTDKEERYVDACKSFIDKLPVQDVRVAIVTFGYYINESWKNSFDEKQIHTLLSLSDLDNNSSFRENLKNQMQEAVRFGRQQKDSDHPATPLGHVLNAGVTLLEDGAALDNKAVIILVTDGVNQPGDKKQDDIMRDDALRTAAAHEWPVCSIQLNYSAGGYTTYNAQDANKYLQTLSRNNKLRGECQKTVTVEDCKSPDDVYLAFVNLFNYAYGIDSPPPELVNLPYLYKVVIPSLVSETTIEVYGKGVKSITIQQKVDDRYVDVYKIDGSVQEQRLVAVKSDTYFSVKLILPKEGKWAAYIDGEGNAEVRVGHSNLRELGLRLSLDALGADLQALTRQDKVTATVQFYYKDIPITSNSFYADADHLAHLVVKDSQHPQEIYPMAGYVDGGYLYEINLRDLAPGKIALWAHLEHEMFYTGDKFSNIVEIHLHGEGVTLISDEPRSITAFVNQDFEPIDLTKIFLNPDKDEVAYRLECLDDSSIQFEGVVKPGSDEMVIRGGHAQGTYHMLITAKDQDSAQPVKYSGLTLEIQDRPPVANPLENGIQLWTGKVPYLQDDLVAGPLDLDLNELFTEPDGQSMQFQWELISSDYLDGEMLDEHTLRLTPKSKGSAELKVIAFDGAPETAVNRVELCVEVKVGSGWVEFLSANWLLILLGLVAFIVLIVLLVIWLRDTGIKGTWEFTFYPENGSPVTEDLNVKKDLGINSKKDKNDEKGKNNLKDVLNAAVENLGSSKSDRERLKETIKVISDDNNIKIMIRGLRGKSGFRIVGDHEESIVSFSSKAAKPNRTWEMSETQNARRIVSIKPLKKR